ncbi:hypothetical protein [Acetobacter musti]|uniref:hypothetical protein n=1 Tax=Acetobacter musti TaxID=864732 RepID=UPI001F55449E|nr:hypothetical protein [Acetobacter musti]
MPSGNAGTGHSASLPSVPLSGNRRFQGFLLVFLFSLLLCLRFHAAWPNGRLVAEEGTIFFRKAWESSWSDALFYSYGGYLNLVTNAGTLLAERCLPLTFAPWLTMLIGLAFQICAPVLLVSAKDDWLRPLWVRAIGVALLLVAPESAEVSLHTLHSQYHLALCCGIILGLRTGRSGQEIFRCILLGLAPLSGPGGVIMAPLFGLRLLFDRSRARLAECLTISICSVIQVVFFFQPFSERTFGFFFQDYVFALFTRYVLWPFFSFGPQVHDLSLYLQDISSHRHVVVVYDVLILLLFTAILVPVSLSIYRNPRARPAGWFFLGGGVHALVAMYGALGGAATVISLGAGERYCFVAQSLFALAILVLVATARQPRRRFGTFILALLLVCGSRHFLKSRAEIVTGPDWRAEVSEWNRNHAHEIRVWRQGWTMKLSPP